MGNNIGRLEIQVPKELEIVIVDLGTHKEFVMFSVPKTVSGTDTKGKTVTVIPKKVEQKNIWTLSIPKNIDIQLKSGISTTGQQNRLIILNANLLVKDINQVKTWWGTLNSILKSIIVGKTQGFTLKLGLKGVGYRFERDPAFSNQQYHSFILHLGFTHPKRIKIPTSIECKLLKGNTILEGKCDNWQELTNVLNHIRLIKPASKDKYSGKGFYIIK